MGKLNLPQRPVMGAVILHAAIYDDAKRLGHDMTGYIRSAPMTEATERERLDARKKLAKWAKSGGKKNPED